MVTNWIQSGVLFTTLLALTLQQWRVLKSAQRAERRITTKLQLFYFMQKKDLSEKDLISQYERTYPTERTDVAELRKSLYEMLKDDTVRFTKKGKYRPPTKKAERNVKAIAEPSIEAPVQIKCRSRRQTLI